MAVPCWSSWKTGISSRALSRFSISKQPGRRDVFEIDTAKAGGEVAHGVDDRVDIGGVERQREGVDPGNSLKSAHLPSMTGMAAAGPMSPSPRTAVPSVTTATVFFLMVNEYASSGRS